MNYINHGDFSLPLTVGYYVAKHMFAWSFQSGAPNLDGIIRLPGRLFSMAIFGLFGNVAAAYAYILFSFGLVFISFYLFAKHFLRVDSRIVLVITSILFTFNPVFLGNISKIGLVAAAGLLPLCLVLVKRFFDTKRTIFLVGVVALLNYSLLHPFTFVINLVVTLIYLIERLVQQRREFKSYVPGLFSAGVIGILLNAYVILPVIAIGSIDKSALSQDVSGQPVNYYDLVEIANTKDLFTAFSLSKDVLKDYEFYKDSTAPMYLVGIYGLYVLAIVLFIVLRSRLNPREHKTALMLLGGLLILLLLSTGTMFLAKLTEIIVNLPGGWIFRSPLKWQLYIPFFLIGLLALLVGKIRSPYVIRPILGLLILALSLYGTFISIDIYEHLLKPKTFHTFAALSAKSLDNQTLLYVSGSQCADYARDHPDTMGEFNEISISRNMQVKTANTAAADRLNLANYNLVLTCKEDESISNASGGRLRLTGEYDRGTFRLYENVKPHPIASAVTSLFSTSDQGGVNERAMFVQKLLGQEYNEVSGKTSKNALEISHVFQDLGAGNISSDHVAVSRSLKPGPANIYQANQSQETYYQQMGQQLLLSAQPLPGYQRLTSSAQLASVASPINIEYRDKRLQYQNSISNGSFEQGSWQAKVDDCFKSADEPVLNMKVEDKASDGKKSLSLSAGRHLACTTHDPIPVKGGSNYVFEFSHMAGPGASSAGFSLVFNDPENSRIDGRPRATEGSWGRYSKTVQAPQGATSAMLYLYGYPPNGGSSNPVTVYYDDFHLTAIPGALDGFYLGSGSSENLVAPREISANFIHPAKRSIHISHAKDPFVLRVEDTYHSKWKLSSINGMGKVGPHMQLNGFENGWYINPASLCKPVGTCRRNADGSYGIDLVMTFTPQKWLGIGLGVSALTAIGCLLYFVPGLRRRLNLARRHK